MSENGLALPEGFRIGAYEIESVLGQGGFGITYLARHKSLKTYVAIKEFVLYGEVRRGKDGTIELISQSNSLGDFSLQRQRFEEEARRLEEFRHDNIVRVRDLIEDNNTAYYVMDYIDGGTLSSLVKHYGALPTTSVMLILQKLIDGLKRVHEKGMVHRDIKPQNILLAKLEEPVETPLPDIPEDERLTVGRPVLIDFGAARDQTHDGRSATNFVSAGFAPFEQYTSRSKPTQQSDIYSLAAVAYYCLGGENPPDSADRQVAPDCFTPAAVRFAETAPPGFLKAIDHGLELRSEDRPTSLRAWRDELFAELDVVWEVTRRTAPSRKTKSSGKGLALGIASGVLTLALLGGGGFWWFATQNTDTTTTQQITDPTTPEEDPQGEDTSPEETTEGDVSGSSDPDPETSETEVPEPTPSGAPVSTVIMLSTEAWTRFERKIESGQIELRSDGPYRLRTDGPPIIIEDLILTDDQRLDGVSSFEVRAVSDTSQLEIIETEGSE
ncbi:MAG: serine/threonine-protein kinase [Pseudomonadota bacterium]